MSSPANNNLPIVQTAASGSVNTGTKQQRPTHDQTGQSSSQPRHRGPSNRNARATTKGLPTGRQSVRKSPQDDRTQLARTESPVENLDLSNPSQASVSNTSADLCESGGPPKTINNRSKGQRPGRVSGTSGGKYKQRQQMNQLIDSMDGLDIDLVESIAPTSSHFRQNDNGKGRHATASRKVNLTHLLNYDNKQRSNRYHHDGGRNNHRHHPQTYYRDFNPVHKFNKQQFLQANCQFVVLPFHDYTIHKVDPDWPVDWDCIEEVKFRQTGTTETTCPICLDPPIAAKITRCGHIYCWTCMLHYLSLSDEKSRQCPICFEPISESDLRSVVSKLYANHSVDEEIVMRLMFRKKGCIEVEPYSCGEQSRTSSPINDVEHYSSEANLLIVDPLTVIAEVTKREQDELLLKLELDRDEPEVCFVEQAMERLTMRIEGLQQMCLDSTKTSSGRQESNQSVEPSAAQKGEKSFLFYQSSDGQHIYLNPFSTKILYHEYGSLNNYPLEIRAKVLQMDWISMSESWRKRFKYLEHLPLTCEFRLIEIDFEESNLVTTDTYKAFEEQIKMRADERTFRKAEELKRDKIIQIEQNRKIYGIQPMLEINLDNEEQFPSVFDENRPSRIKSTETADQVNEIEPEQVESLVASVSSEQQREDDSGISEKLSFKAIQERQEAAEARDSLSKGQTAGRWGNSTNSRTQSKSSQQSSFAKLLVDAKTTPKQWTRNMNSATPKQQPIAQPGVVQHRSQIAPKIMLIDPDESGEELRAPPCRFTINDFLNEKRSGRRQGKKS